MLRIVLVALFASSVSALKAPLGKLGQSRVASSPVAKAGALTALPAIFSAAPAWAKDAALSVSPYGTGGEGTSDSLGINDSSLLGVLLGMSGLIFTLYLGNQRGIPDEDFFDGIDNKRCARRVLHPLLFCVGRASCARTNLPFSVALVRVVRLLCELTRTRTRAPSTRAFRRTLSCACTARSAKRSATRAPTRLERRATRVSTQTRASRRARRSADAGARG